METEAGQLRNLRDFLMVYNRMTEICFGRCSSNFNYRSLTLDEERCVDSCAGKLIRSNHRLMGTYVQLMPKMVQKRMDEMEAKVAENAKAAEAAAGAPAVGEELGVPAAAEGSPPEPQIPIITPSPSSETTPALISPSVTEVGLVQLAADATGQLACMPEQVSPPSSFVLGGEAAVIPEVASGPLLTPTPLDVSTELRPVGSASTTAVQPVTESKMAAATLLTPVMDTVNVNGPGVTAFLPLETPPTVTELPPLVGGVQVESGSSVPPASVQPMLTPPTPVASPVSTIAVPIMSKATEIVTVPERPQEVPPAADK